MTFLQRLEAAITKNNSLVCVGLDPDLQKIPSHLLNEEDPIFEFNKAIIDQTHDLVSCYKVNIAYYSASDIAGLGQLKMTVDYLREQYPDIPLILDAKRADIGNTSEQYAREAFDVFLFDAVTVSPYLGYDGIEPFLKRKEKGIIVLCKTSNQGAADFQDLIVSPSPRPSLAVGEGVITSPFKGEGQDEGEPLYIHVAKKVVEWNRKFGNCLLVVGATWPEQMKTIRAAAPNMFFLVPGAGAQGGNLEKTLANGLRVDKSGLLMHSARYIIYAGKGNDFAEEARGETIKLRDEINKYR